MPVVGDFCPHGDLRELAGAVDALIVPQTCAKQLSPEGNWLHRLETLGELGAAFAVITAGADGCYYLDEGNLVHQPAFPVKAVDTTGAGDAFHGAFAYGMAARWHAPRCIRFASAVAALSTRALGGRRALPTLAEVERFPGRSKSPEDNLRTA